MKVAHVLKKSTCNRCYFLLLAALLTLGSTGRVHATIDAETSPLPTVQEPFKEEAPDTEHTEISAQLHDLALQHKSRGEYSTADSFSSVPFLLMKRPMDLIIPG